MTTSQLPAAGLEPTSPSRGRLRIPGLIRLSFPACCTIVRPDSAVPEPAVGRASGDGVMVDLGMAAKLRPLPGNGDGLNRVPVADFVWTLPQGSFLFLLDLLTGHGPRDRNAGLPTRLDGVYFETSRVGRPAFRFMERLADWPTLDIVGFNPVGIAKTVAFLTCKRRER